MHVESNAHGYWQSGIVDCEFRFDAAAGPIYVLARSEALTCRTRHNIVDIIIPSVANVEIAVDVCLARFCYGVPGGAASGRPFCATSRWWGWLDSYHAHLINVKDK
jgi:hypothetical protein